MTRKVVHWLRLLSLFVLVYTAIPALAPGGTCSAAAVSERRKVIVDEDAFGPAGTNLQAILMLLQSSNVEVLGITVPSGDGWRDEEVRDALRLLEVAKRTRVPVYPGAVFPLVNSQNRTRRWEQLYGKLYYKGAWTEVWSDQNAVRRAPYHADPYFVPPSPAGEPSIKAMNENAVDFMIREVHEFPGQVTILAAGPLTDIALAARMDPQFSSLARELVFMGGSFRPAPTNSAFAAEYANAPRREFNMRWDPEAASIVLHEAWKRITEVPVDPTVRTSFSPAFIRKVATGRAPFDAYLSRFGQSFPMWDELAVAVWLDPSIVTRSATLLVDIDTSFTASYGDTLSWPPRQGPALGERPVRVIFDIDVAKFDHMVLALLTAPAPEAATRPAQEQ